MRIFLPVLCLLFVACKKENPAKSESCDVYGMYLDGQYGMPIEYDASGRVSAYHVGTDRITIDYTNPGHVYFYRNNIYFKSYHLNDKGLASSRAVSESQIYDSIAYEYDNDGFLIKELKGAKEISHSIVDGDRVLTLERLNGFSGKEYIDSIRYYYNTDSLALFHGGDRYTFLGKKYTHRLKSSVRTSNYDTLIVTNKYFYEYGADGKLALMRQISSGGFVGSNTGWYIHWRCE